MSGNFDVLVLLAKWILENNPNARAGTTLAVGPMVALFLWMQREFVEVLTYFDVISYLLGDIRPQKRYKCCHKKQHGEDDE